MENKEESKEGILDWFQDAAETPFGTYRVRPDDSGYNCSLNNVDFAYFGFDCDEDTDAEKLARLGCEYDFLARAKEVLNMIAPELVQVMGG